MEEDTWGRDPSVRSMRRVFAAIEAGQERLLKVAEIGPLNQRLGPWRKMALHTFEKVWVESVRSGANLYEKDIADLYVYCLANVLEKDCVAVPSGLLAANPAVKRLVEEKR
jgi:hypothetical protein